MKINFICFKFSKTISIMICIILLEIILLGIQNQETARGKEFNKSNIILNKEDKNNIPCTATEKDESKEVTQEKIEKQSRVIPEKLKEFEIIGKLEIPKLKLEKYILKENNSKALKASVVKLEGPELNEIGNFCIAGHNYNKMFRDIKNLEKNDKIILTDIYGKSITYQVYDNYKTSPKDISCLSQDTELEKEVTLITCNTGANKRVIIKAVEIYD